MIRRLRKSATTPASPDTGTVAPKRRLRRLAGIAAIAALAVAPASVAVQTSTAPRAEAAVDNNNPNVVGPVALAVLHYWLNWWPSTNNGQNSVYQNGGGYVNGGGVYNDRSGDLRRYIYGFLNIPQQQQAQHPLTFREYDDTARPTPSTGRNAGRYVYNPEYRIVFHTVDHYNNFTPLNFGFSPWGFPTTVYCYQNPPGSQNNTRIALYSGRSVVIGNDPYHSQNTQGWGTEGFPDTGMSVEYTVAHEQWDPQGYYYQPAGSHTTVTGSSFTVIQTLSMYNNYAAICQHWTGYRYGYRG